MANHYLQRLDLSKYTLKSFDSVDEVCFDTNNSDILTYNANGTVVTIPTSNPTPTITASSVAVATNEFYVKTTLTPASAITATLGLSSIKGEIDLTSGKTLNGTSFVIGVNGRANIFGTVDIGSGDLAAVYAKMDLNGSTLTSGHIAPLQSNIVNPPASALGTVNLVYVESAGGNPINSFFQAFGKATYVMDLASNTHTQMSTSGTAGSTSSKGWLKVLVEGVVRYIPLTDSVS